MDLNSQLRRFLVFSCTLVAFCATALASPIDRNAFTFTKYDLEVRLDPESQQMTARGHVILRNDSNEPQQLATLQISSSLEWRLIQLGDQQLEYVSKPYTTDIDHTGVANEAVVKLPAPVTPGQVLDLEVGYSGSVEINTTRLTRMDTPQPAADASEWDQIGQPFTGLRGVGYVLWYPVSMPAANLSEGDLSVALGKWQQRETRTDMKVKACWIAPEGHRLTVLSNGQFQGMEGGDQQEGSSTGCSAFHFASLGNLIPMLVMGEFKVLQRLQMNLYYLSETKDDAENFALAAEKVRPMVTEWFGEPKSTLQIIDLPVPNGDPFESGTTLIAPFKMDSRVTQLTMAHAWVHACFTSERPWIQEGLAHFAAVLQREQQDGKKAAISYLQSRQPALAFDQPETAGDAAGSALANTTDDNIYRNKGMFVWWMLRSMLGDRALQTAIQNYRSDQDKEQSYMQRLLETASKRNLEWFFDDWVYRDHGLPDLRIDAAVPRETLKGAYIVAVTVENQGAAAADVPIVVRGENGENIQRLQVSARAKATTRVAVQGKPQEVIVNDGSVPEVRGGAHVYKFPLAVDASTATK